MGAARGLEFSSKLINLGKEKRGFFGKTESSIVPLSGSQKPKLTREGTGGKRGTVLPDGGEIPALPSLQDAKDRRAVVGLYDFAGSDVFASMHR